VVTAPITEAVGRATATQFAAHLERCDAVFVPPLSSRVSIDAYAAKLVRHAICLEFWAGDQLVASVAMYCGDDAFISNVSVDPQWSRRGLAARLLQRAIIFSWQRDLPRLRLEVAESNAAAVALYRRTGFAVTAERDGTLAMQLLNPNGVTDD
jgi:ribosomal-protein-alanine N-acetyltransferase